MSKINGPKHFTLPDYVPLNHFLSTFNLDPNDEVLSSTTKHTTDLITRATTSQSQPSKDISKQLDSCNSPDRKIDLDVSSTICDTRE